MIKVQNLDVGYPGAFHLQGINLEVEKGGFCGIIGPNGSGKSTLLKAISKVLPSTGGKIFIDGEDLHSISLPKLARKMAVVGSEAQFAFPYLVSDVVLMGRIPFLNRFGSYAKSDHEIVEKALVKTRAAEFKDRHIEELSSGERQRVLLARALAQEPRVLLLDEPTAHLDLHFEIEIFRILQKLNSEEGLTIVTVSHNLNLMGEFCRTLVVMKGGACELIGTPSEVLKPEVLGRVFHVQGQIGTNPYSGSPIVLLNSKGSDA